MTNRKFSHLTPSEKQQIIEALKQTKNMREFLVYLNVVFDMERCTPGTITKNILAQQMVNTVLSMINPEIK